MTTKNNFPWWKWPQTRKHHSFAPWYVIIRRLLVIVPFKASLSIAFVCILLGYGWDEAKMFWRQAA